MYIPKNFKAYELVDKKTYDKFGNLAIRFFRKEALIMLDDLRQLLQKPLYINNWYDGGNYEWSGLRTPDYIGGAKWSAHRFGAGFDVKCRTMAAAELQDFIRRKHKEGKLQNIKRMEIGTPSWTHIDCIETTYNYLFEFKPE